MTTPDNTALFKNNNNNNDSGVSHRKKRTNYVRQQTEWLVLTRLIQSQKLDKKEAL
jgi:hypothetical protein